MLILILVLVIVVVVSIVIARRALPDEAISSFASSVP
jgi:hypothetical protein